MTTYRLPNIHQQEADQASSNFEKAVEVLKELSGKMESQLHAKLEHPEYPPQLMIPTRAEFQQRARNLKQAKRSQRSEE
jgi:hypothetical protein